MYDLVLQFVIFSCLGTFTGASAALLGIGGGVVVVPCLSMILPFFGVPADQAMVYAVGSSFSIMIFTSSSSTIAHWKKRNVLWDVFWRFAPGLFVGVILGRLTAGCFKSDILSVLFGIVLLAVAAKMFFDLKTSSGSHDLPKGMWLSASGSVIGFIAGLLGIGGGPVSVPFLSYFSVPMKKVVGTSSVFSLPVSLIGTSWVLFSSLGKGTVRYSLGHIYLPALFGVALFCVLSAPLGAKLADRLPAKGLRRIFAVLLFIVALKMIMVFNLFD